MDHFEQFTLRTVRKCINLFWKFYSVLQRNAEVSRDYWPTLSTHSMSCSSEQMRLARLQSMLDRTSECQRMIEFNARLAQELQLQIDALNESLSRLDREVEVKKTSFSSVSEVVVRREESDDVDLDDLGVGRLSRRRTLT